MENIVTKLEMPTIPAHLLVYDAETPFLTRKNQIEELITLSKDHWIAKSALGYYVFRHKDVSAILKDKRWHSGLYALHSLRPGADPEVTARRGNTLSAMDGEDHSMIRMLVAPAFSPSSAQSQKDFAYKCAKNLIQDIVNSNQNEFIKNFCNKYPILVLCNTIGLPEGDWEKFIEWGKVLSSPITSNEAIDLSLLKRVESEFFKYISKMAADRRRNPQDDLITKLAISEKDGKTLSDSQLTLIIGTMISGGVETLIGHLGMMLVYLCDNPDIYAELRNNKDLIPDAVLEITRLTSSIRGSLRIASEDIEYNGVLFPKGTFVFTSIASANQDESLYTNPGEFVLGRNHGSDMSFGAGMHYCLGAHLAKVEMAEIVAALVDSFESIEIESVKYRPSNSGIFSPTVLNIKYKEG